MSAFRLGYVLAGEDHPPRDLIKWGTQAEQAGFEFLFVSDHFHPWNHSQGCSSFVWSVLGALAQSTESVELFNAVSCPGQRLHLTSLAQAAVTIRELSRGRFTLGLGTGEFLNEHVTGIAWPRFSERLSRLAEAVPLLRDLFSGLEVHHSGHYFTVDRAQLFGESPKVPLALAASGVKSATLAGKIGADLISLGADRDVVEAYRRAGGQGRKYTQLSVCWGKSETEAASLAHKLWPEVALSGSLFTRLATPDEFEAATRDISCQDVAAAIVCGSELERYEQAISECKAAGFDGVALHAIGPDQESFFTFWRDSLSPYLTQEWSIDE